MTSAQLKENIEDGLHRLRLAYDACMDGYNRAMSKELASSLRYWADMNGEVNRYITENRPTTRFWSYSIVAKFSREIREKEYVIVCYPKGLSTTVPYTLSGNPNTSKYDQETFLVPVGDYQEIPIRFSINSRRVGALHFVKHAIVVFDSEIQLESRNNDPATDNMCFAYSKTGFSSWLSQLAVRVSKKDQHGKVVMHNIDRETIIRRLANKWGGSHPKGADNVYNNADEVIEFLMEYRVLNIPLPHTILLKIAQDILDGFDYLKGAKSQPFTPSRFSLPPESSLTPLPLPDKAGPFSKDTPAVLQYFICNKCGISKLIQYNLIKGTPVQYLAGAEMCPANNIIACPVCKQQADLAPERTRLELMQGSPTFTD
jgi:hypothetical protein